MPIKSFRGLIKDEEIDTILLTKLVDLLETEVNLRELGMDMPTDETRH